MLLDGIGVKDPPEYAVDDEVDAAVDRDQKVVGLGELVVSLVQVLSTSII